MTTKSTALARPGFFSGAKKGVTSLASRGKNLSKATLNLLARGQKSSTTSNAKSTAMKLAVPVSSGVVAGALNATENGKLIEANVGLKPSTITGAIAAVLAVLVPNKYRKFMEGVAVGALTVSGGEAGKRFVEGSSSKSTAGTDDPGEASGLDESSSSNPSQPSAEEHAEE